MEFMQFSSESQFGYAGAELTESIGISAVKLMTWNQHDPAEFLR